MNQQVFVPVARTLGIFVREKAAEVLHQRVVGELIVIQHHKFSYFLHGKFFRLGIHRAKLKKHSALLHTTQQTQCKQTSKRGYRDSELLFGCLVTLMRVMCTQHTSNVSKCTKRLASFRKITINFAFLLASRTKIALRYAADVNKWFWRFSWQPAGEIHHVSSPAAHGFAAWWERESVQRHRVCTAAWCTIILKLARAMVGTENEQISYRNLKNLHIKWS